MNGELRCNPANASITGAETEETLCDQLDNDCDGRIDEMIPAVGKPCSLGTGRCMRSGTYVCDSNPPRYCCDAAAPGSATAEECNGQDDDCNGVIDDIASPSRPQTSRVSKWSTWVATS